MRESCLVYCYSGIQSLFEVVLLYTFYTVGSHRLYMLMTRVLCLNSLTAPFAKRPKVLGGQSSWHKYIKIVHLVFCESFNDRRAAQ